MIISGNCSWIHESEKDYILDTARALKGLATHFRCKLWLGGTTPEKYVDGIGSTGLKTLEQINKYIMTAGTEIQIPEHITDCNNNDLGFVWVGARNSQNYRLLEHLSEFKGQVMLKRGFGMTIDEVIGLYDIMDKVNNKKSYIIERGINTFDRKESSRWSPDLKGIIRLKHERPDIFNDIIIDCSHSMGQKELIKDCYVAFKSIGVQHFMFECTLDGETKTDKSHMLSVKELEDILK